MSDGAHAHVIVETEDHVVDFSIDNEDLIIEVADEQHRIDRHDLAEVFRILDIGYWVIPEPVPGTSPSPTAPPPTARPETPS